MWGDSVSLSAFKNTSIQYYATDGGGGGGANLKILKLQCRLIEHAR